MERLILMSHGGPDALAPETIIRCRVNPSDLTLRRDSGLAPRPRPLFAESVTAQFMPTGAGVTVLETRLLFEVDPAQGPEADVRSETGALFRLAGPRAAPAGQFGLTPQIVDVIWGRHWSFRGTISDISETLDHFDASGRATRSWVSLRMLAAEDRLRAPEVLS